jgi:ubiquinone/menaquinone biosynthesis C-methylase UbiE
MGPNPPPYTSNLFMSLWIYSSRQTVRLRGVILRDKNKYKKIEQWQIYDRIAGTEPYSNIDKEFLPNERYDWTLLTEIELFRNAVKGCQRVLDIGCGTGHPSLYIAKDVGSITGIDRSERMIKIARNRLSRSDANNIVFEAGNVEALKFSDSSFDAVILCGSLATFSDKKKALQEIKRVLEKNGKVACIEANWLFQSAQERHFKGEGNFALTERGLIKYRFVKRSLHPHKETDYRCLIDQKSALGKKLLSDQHFLKDKTLKTEMTVEEVEPYCTEIEYDEEEKFDAENLACLFSENGFKDINIGGYGVIYDLLSDAKLVKQMSPYMKQLTKAEAAMSSFLNPLKTEMLFLTCRI